MRFSYLCFSKECFDSTQTPKQKKERKKNSSYSAKLSRAEEKDVKDMKRKRTNDKYWTKKFFWWRHSALISQQTPHSVFVLSSFPTLVKFIFLRAANLKKFSSTANFFSFSNSSSSSSYSIHFVRARIFFYSYAVFFFFIVLYFTFMLKNTDSLKG